MEDPIRGIVYFLGAIFIIFVLASGLSSRNQSIGESVSEAAEETRNSLPVLAIGVVIVIIALVSGAVAR